MDEETPGRAFYTVAEVAKLLDYSVRRTTDFLRMGTLPGKKVSRKWLIPKRELDARLSLANEGKSTVQGARQIEIVDDADPRGVSHLHQNDRLTQEHRGELLADRIQGINLENNTENVSRTIWALREIKVEMDDHTADGATFLHDHARAFALGVQSYNRPSGLTDDLLAELMLHGIVNSELVQGKGFSRVSLHELRHDIYHLTEFGGQVVQRLRQQEEHDHSTLPDIINEPNKGPGSGQGSASS